MSQTLNSIPHHLSEVMSLIESILDAEVPCTQVSILDSIVAVQNQTIVSTRVYLLVDKDLISGKWVGSLKAHTWKQEIFS